MAVTWGMVTWQWWWVTYGGGTATASLADMMGEARGESLDLALRPPEGRPRGVSFFPNETGPPLARGW
jgi:hypothetical protein